MKVVFFLLLKMSHPLFCRHPWFLFIYLFIIIM